jgi:hypothetical protein
MSVLFLTLDEDIENAGQASSVSPNRLNELLDVKCHLGLSHIRGHKSCSCEVWRD